jgi:predicted ATP-grasp superfamily ATP-dependent carboligase
MKGFKMNWKNLIIGIVVVALMVAGCQMIEDKIIPASIPPALVKYVDKDPNKIGYPSKEKLGNFMEEAKVKHIVSQAEWQFMIDKDKTVYAEVARMSEISMKQAIADSAMVFGQNGLLVGLLGLIGGGVAVGMYKNATMYSEAEVSTVKTTAATDAAKILYTEDEVTKLKNDAVNSALAIQASIAAAAKAGPTAPIQT